MRKRKDERNKNQPKIFFFKNSHTMLDHRLIEFLSPEFKNIKTINAVRIDDGKFMINIILNKELITNEKFILIVNKINKHYNDTNINIFYKSGFEKEGVKYTYSYKPAIQYLEDKEEWRSDSDESDIGDMSTEPGISIPMDIGSQRL